MQSDFKHSRAGTWCQRLFAIMCLALIAPITYAAEPPAPIQSLEQQGARIGESFDAPGEMTGYMIFLRGRPMTVYVMPDGEHAVVGTMIDGQANNLSRARIEEAGSKPSAPDIWSRLADSRWIADGSEDAERVVYTFTDPNCPYCHAFWEAARPWVNGGAVQLRHVMVGVLKPSSAPKAATLLAADDSSQALTEHEQAYSSGGVTPRDDLAEAARKAVEQNNQLMHDLGYYATPTTVYRDSDGEVRQKQGQPRGEALIEIMGGPAQ